MFLEYYGLQEQPFGVTPDPRYLYFSSTHREALASLFYGIEADRGFVTLIAPPGMGKTTLLFHLLERLRGVAHTAFLFQTQCDSRELFQYLLTDLGISVGNQNLASMHEQLNEKLLSVARAGKRFVLVIDEAQNLEDSVLETVRLLSDLETTQSKLMQIVLSGQPQLADKLSRPGLAQLRQRISMVSRLEPFSTAEVMVYIEHRLRIAGYDGDPLFTSDALALISTESGGIPRNINNLCFNSLSLGCAQWQKKIDSRIIREVLSDLSLDLLGSRLTATRHMVPGSPPAHTAPTWNGETVRDGLQAAARAVWKTERPVTNQAATTKSTIPRAPRTLDGDPGARSSDVRPGQLKPPAPVAQVAGSFQGPDLIVAERPVSPVVSLDATARSVFSVQSPKSNDENHTNPPPVWTESQESPRLACSSESLALREGSGGVSVADQDPRSSFTKHWRANLPRPEDAGEANLRVSPMLAKGAEAARVSNRRQDRGGSDWPRRMLMVASQVFSRLPSVSIRNNLKTRLGRVTLRSASLASGVVLLSAVALILQVRHGARTQATTVVAPPQTTQAAPKTDTIANSKDPPTTAEMPNAEKPVARGIASPKTLKPVVTRTGKLLAPRVLPKEPSMLKGEEPPPNAGAVRIEGGDPGGVSGGQLGPMIGGMISDAQKSYMPTAPTAPQPQAFVHVGGRVKQPRPISTPSPVYPALASQSKIQGDVLIDAVIDPKGNVIEMRVVSGHPVLIPAAKQALHKWKYEPASLNDEPIAVHLIVIIRFRLGG